jgi:hypothetical protein
MERSTQNEFTHNGYQTEGFWAPSAMTVDQDTLILTRHRLEQQYRRLKKQLVWTAGALTAVFVAIIIF